MHPTVRRLAILAWIAACAPLQGFAQAAPSGDEAALFASPRWRELTAKLRDDAFRPVDEARLRAACHDALAKPPAPGRTAMDTCLAAALAATDARGQFYSAADMADRHRDAHGAVGVGLVLAGKEANGALHVKSAMPDGPGARAGILPGDLVLRIDGVDLAPLTLEQCVQALRGPLDSTATLEIERGPMRQGLTVAVRRAAVVLPSVERGPVSPTAVVLRIARFDLVTFEQLGKQADELLRSRPAPPDALVLDLRGNAGGLLGAMLQVAGAMSSDDTVVAHLVTRQDDTPLTGTYEKASPYVLSKDAQRWLRRVRVIVLQDEGTASGAEAFALFLREQRHAPLYGRRSMGRANLDTVMMLSADTGMRMQTGELRSGKQVAWDGKGVEPDVVIPIQYGSVRSTEDGSTRDLTLLAIMRALEAH